MFKRIKNIFSTLNPFLALACLLIVGIIAGIAHIYSIERPQPLSQDEYRTTLHQTVQDQALVTCTVGQACPYLGVTNSFDYTSLTGEGHSVTYMTNENLAHLVEGQPYRIRDLNTALVTTLAHQQWEIKPANDWELWMYPFAVPRFLPIPTDGVEGSWYVSPDDMMAPLAVVNPIGSGKTAMFTLWRFGDTLYIVTGTEQSLNVNEPLRTASDLEGSDSLTRERIERAFAPTKPHPDIQFTPVVLVDGQLYEVAYSGKLIPYSSVLSDRPDSFDRYVITMQEPTS